MYLSEAYHIIQRAHPFQWKGCQRTFFEEDGEQVFCVWKDGKIIFRVTESELAEALHVVRNPMVLS